MTTSDLPSPAASIPTVTALRRAAAAEWTRTWTVRSTWWALLASLGTALAMAATFALDPGTENHPPWIVGEYTIVIAQLPLLVLVMLQVTSEYATGAIRSSLQWVPRRSVLLTARISVATIVATVGGVLTALAADLTAWLWRGQEITVGDLTASLANVAIVIGSAALLTAALATILRSTAATLASAFLLLMLLPAALTEIGVPWLEAVGLNMPGMALALLESLQLEDDTRRILQVLGAWIAATTSTAGWLFTRRDAT